MAFVRGFVVAKEKVKIPKGRFRKLHSLFRLCENDEASYALLNGKLSIGTYLVQMKAEEKGPVKAVEKVIDGQMSSKSTVSL